MKKGRWNIIGYEKDWKKYPETLDFLDKKSDYYEIKKFEKEVYLEIIKPFLKKIKKNSLILDACGGIGRFAIELAKIGYKVNLVDASKTNIKVARKHILKEKLTDRIDTYTSNIEDLSAFEDEKYDTILAIEAICYCSNPEKALKELLRVLKPNGLIFISVENKYGSILSDTNITSKNFLQVCLKNKLEVKNCLYVQYYTKEMLEKLLNKLGVKILKFISCHYVAEGIFNRFFDYKNKKKLMEIERFCRNDFVLRNLARAWFVVGKKVRA